MRSGASVLAILLSFVAVAHTAARADWIAGGVPLCPSAAIQTAPLIVSDGSGGAIVAWRSFLDNESNVVAQRIDAAGNTLWGGDGALICEAASDQTPSDMIPDGAGGAIILWEDYRNGSWDIYAQRVDASGTVQWIPNGVPFCTAGDIQYGAEVASDGAGGAIAAWHDRRNGASFHIYAQRVNAAGAVQWAANGVPVCMADNGQFAAEIISDGAGGAIVAWHDIRLNPNYDIYAQRVNASGASLWTLNGVPVCAAGNLQKYAELVSDGAGGAIIIWKDNRTSPDDLYAQRVNASGVAQWTLNGVPVCTAPGAQEQPQIVPAGAGSTFIAWQDARAGEYDIYAQRLTASGGAQCMPNGFAICTAANEQSFPAIAADGTGGAIVAWQDYRDGINFNNYAASTRFSSVAPASIDFGTVPVGQSRDTAFTIENTGCSVLALDVGETCEHFQIITDELVLFLWPGQSLTVTIRFEPTSAGAHACEVATGPECSPVNCTGVGTDHATGDDTPLAPEATFLAQNFPNPFNPATEISFGLIEPANVSLRIYDAAGGLVRELAAGQHAAGAYRKIWNGRDANGAAVSSGIYFYRLEAGAFSQTRKMVLLR